MPLPSAVQDFIADSLAVIANQEADVIAPVLKDCFHRRAVRMSKGVHQGFRAYAINLVPRERLEGARCPLYYHVVLDRPFASQILRNLYQSALQIFLFGMPPTKTLYRVAAFIHQLSQHLRDALDERLRTRIAADLTLGDFKLKRCTGQALKNGIM